MSDELLRTKLFIPRLRPNLVPRPLLIEQLNQGLKQKHKLTLISAPAGFGKTTLTCEWVNAMRQDTANLGEIFGGIAWLTLDESDNDPARFLAYLVASLNQIEEIEPAIGNGALAMIQSPQPTPTEDVLISLINDIATIAKRVILVLDDYHVIESPTVDDAVAFMVEHLPERMQLVVVTRDDPSLPLARLRAQGQLTELRAANLRFTFQEAATFLNQSMGLALSPENIAALEMRTEGWIAGLQLAALSMSGHEDVDRFIQSFTGSHRFVLDYLLEEVLDQQSETIQTFLLQTSLCDRLTGALCEALTGQPNGAATLETLDHANLFIISLDEERRWYRYHNLFADLLRLRLNQLQPDKLLLLHKKASRWFEENGFKAEAVEHALRARDFAQAALLIEKSAAAEFVKGDSAKLERWLDHLPIELIYKKPQLAVYYAWYLLANGKLNLADRAIRAAEKSAGADAGDSSVGTRSEQTLSESLQRQTLAGRIATTRAFSSFYRGDVAGIIHHARHALECLPATDRLWRSTALHILGDGYDLNGQVGEAYLYRVKAVEASEATGNTFLILIANLKLAIILRHQGHLQDVKEICERQMQLAQASGMGQTAVAGWLRAIWGEVLAELNELEEAVHLAKKGVVLTERHGDLAMLGWSYLCLGRVLFSSGNFSGAAEILNRFEVTARENFMPPWLMSQMTAWQGRLWLAQGNLASAWRLVEGGQLVSDGKVSYQQENMNILLARILILQDRQIEALSLLEKLLEAAEKGGRTSRQLEILLLQAQAYQAKDDAADALKKLGKALRLAEPGGFCRIFLDEGSALAQLLSEAVSRGISAHYAAQILSVYIPAEPKEINGPKPHPSQSVLIEPLSEREIEVLHHVANGLTNQEIADRLFLSLNTIKVHTRNIYSKLGVHSRMQAVAQSRELGLLPSH